MKKRENGFTLIELLVVISIIALLLSILMPSLSMVKRQARGVVCMSNLKQWALAYCLYTEENNGKFADPAWTSDQNSYVEVLRDYYDDLDSIRFCPEARKRPTTPFWNTAGAPGDTFEAWELDPTAIGWLPDDDSGLGSYGENYYIRDGVGELYWAKSNMAGARDVPMLADAKWHNFGPQQGDMIPTGAVPYGINQWAYVDTVLMRRHKDGVNIAFADFTVRNVEAEKLWDLKWNRIYEPRGEVDLSWLE